MTQKFQSMVAWLQCFGPVKAQYIMVDAYGRGELFTSWQPGSKERGQDLSIAFNGTPAVI